MLARRTRRGGFVLILVLFVLLALFALTAPFLATARNADAASHFEANDVQVRLALDGAGRHARYSLGNTHPALDETPYFDSLEELRVRAEFPEELFDAADAEGVAFGIEAMDLAGLIDVNSASPHVLSNLLGTTARLGEPIESDASSFRVSNPQAFAPESVIVIDGELIRLAPPDEEERLSLQVAERGLGTTQDDEGVWQTTGPAPPSTHGVGAYVLDQRTFAPAIWRTLGPDGEPQIVDTLEELAASDQFSMSGGFDDQALLSLRGKASAEASLGAGPVWQRSTRLIAPLQGGVSIGFVPDTSRWMGIGSTVRISDGLNTELRVVTRIGQGGNVFIDRVLDYDYEAFLTEIEVLARRPVNVNTAPAEVLFALVANLSLRGQNHRIDDTEARVLVQTILESRPFTGLEDFVERLVLPAGGIDVLPTDAPVLPSAFEEDAAIFDDPRDAVALYHNALNANDARLEFSTMPFAFTTRQVFAFALRANVSASSGIARGTGARDRVELIVPQRNELFHLFTRQEDFDDLLRLTRAAPFWLTGPETTGRYDGGVTPPSRATPHLGTLNGRAFIPGISEPVVDDDGNPVPPERVYASRQDDSFLQLEPIRLQETQFTNGRMLHFDQESRTLEGRYVPDQLVERASDDGKVGWTGRNGPQVVSPLTFSMWMRPEGAGDGTLMSIGDRTLDSDRIVLGMSGADLVLRVLDGMGDHRDTAFEEETRLRFPIASGPGVPGLPVGVWSHVSVDVRGNRPDQIDMLVNGNATGVERLGMTRLTAPLTAGGGAIAVESTEGFPDVCVVRIGAELIEVTVSGGTTLDVVHGTAGELAGFGGRLARVRFDVEGSLTPAPTPEALAAVSGSYGVGTPVVHYGYSLPLTENVPSGQSLLPGDLGPFRVARCMGLPDDNSLVPIQASGVFGPFNLGRGWDSQLVGPLTLALADNVEAGVADVNVMEAFDPTGGYAVLSGPSFTFDGGDPNNPSGEQIGGVEVIRYSGYQDNTLQVVERGIQLLGLEGADPDVIGGARAFIFDWDVLLLLGNETLDPDTVLGASTFCFPISISVPGASALSYAEPGPGASQFAQITRLDDPDLTEWIRYDEVDLANGQLVRSDATALLRAHNMLDNLTGADLRAPGPGGGGGGAGGGGGGGIQLPGGGSGMAAGGASAAAPSDPGSIGGPVLRAAPSAASAAARAPRRQAGAEWDPVRGVDPNLDLPLSQAVASTLHFRGVLGTHSGSHPAGTPVLPVVEIGVNDFDFEQGRPGANDAVFVVDGDLNALGFPVTVHRAHLPAAQRAYHGWTATPGTLVANDGNTVEDIQIGFDIVNRCYVAFEGPVLAPTTPGLGPGANAAYTDPRFYGRLVKFPSGELPRSGATVAVGSGAGGQPDFGVASCTIDEVIFGNAEANRGYAGTQPFAHAAGAPLLLSARAGEGDQSFSVVPNSLRLPERTVSFTQPAIGQYPQAGGLVRIGEEIIAYDSYQAGSGIFNVAVDGRGMLGTLPQPHEPTEAVHWLEGWQATTLAAAVGPDEAVLPLVSTEGFPSEGTVLIGQELVHYTRVFGGALVMPRSSNEPGMRDGLGPGVFRGRFGTVPGSFPPGTPVVLFPARYWDRYAPRFDGPELSYFQLHVDQPGGWWRGVTWDSQQASLGGAEILVMQRVGDVPWDADPEDEPRLTLLEDGTVDGDIVPIGLQGDRIEWRVFSRYAAGAFDPEFGLQHGWKQTPRFVRLGVTYTAPGRVIRSMER
ncbi:MAG: hypothetical protein AAGB93_02745 [Planctomycetota bacterium]